MSENKSENKRKGVLWIAASASAFGAMPVLARIAYDDGVDSFTLLFLRFLTAGLVLLAWTRIQRIALPTKRTLAGLIMMGGFLYVGESVAYFEAFRATSAGIAAVLLYLYPTLVALFSIFFLAERLNAIRIAALACALVGAALTVGPSGQVNLIGALLGVSSAVLYAFFVLAGSIFTRGVNSLAASTVIFLSASTVFGGIVAVRGAHLPTTWQSWSAIVAIALFSTVLAIVGLFNGLKHVSATVASTLSTLEPVVTLILAAIFLNENIAPLQMLGASFILTAVLLLARATPSSAT